MRDNVQPLTCIPAIMMMICCLILTNHEPAMAETHEKTGEIIAMETASDKSPAAGADEESGKSPVTLNSVTVTAHKRKQEMGDIPDSITLLSDVDIEDAGITDMEGLSAQVPGLNFYNFGSRRHSIAFMRGVKNLHTGEPATGFYVDGVNYGKSYMFDFPLFDVERIEVLKGPQGTLYGKNSMGGVINIHTRQPDNETEARAGADYGSDNLKEMNGFLRTPLIKDKLFLGLAGTVLSKDGYMENDISASGEDGRHTEGGAGRVKLRYRPEDNLDITLTLDAQKYDGGAFPLRRTERNSFVKNAIFAKNRAYHYSHDFEGTAEDRFWGGALNAEYRMTHHTLTWITGYRDYRDKESLDSDFSSFDMTRLNYDQDEKSFTQEIRLSSSGTRNIDWLAGIYYFYNDSENKQESLFRSGMAGNPNNPFGMGTGSRLLDSEGENKGAALFGQMVLALPAHLELTAGLRYEREKASMDRTMINTPDQGSVSRTVFPGASNDFIGLLPKASLAWDVTENHRIYTTISWGQRSGGFNTTSQADLMDFDEETSRLYEIGAKLGFPGQRLSLNLAGFYMDIDDEQISQFDTETNTPYTVNAGESHRLGLEAELAWTLAPGLNMNAGLTLLEAEYDRYSDPSAGVDYEGNRVFGVPDYTFNLGLGYRRPLWGQWNFMGRIDLSGTGTRYFDDANTAGEKPYQVVNLKLGMEGRHLDTYLWTRNLFDQHYITFENAAKGIAEDGGPRAVGISVNYRF